MIKKAFITIVCLLLMHGNVIAGARIFRWLSESGSMIMNGGKIAQKNYSGTNCINVRKGDEWALMLIGQKEHIKDEGTESSTYLELTLNDGRTFHAGDQIQVTAFRYASNDGEASIAFIFNNDTEITDNNTWADINPGGEEEGGGNSVGNEPFGSGGTFGFPETYEFIVPQEADGASALRMTRDKAEAYLYISGMEIFAAEEATGICVEKTSNKMTKTFTTQGLLVNDNMDIRKGHIYINNGKKIMK